MVQNTAAVGGSIVGLVGPLLTFGEPQKSCELGVFSILMFLAPPAEVTL